MALYGFKYSNEEKITLSLDKDGNAKDTVKVTMNKGIGYDELQNHCFCIIKEVKGQVYKK